MTHRSPQPSSEGYLTHWAWSLSAPKLTEAQAMAIAVVALIVARKGLYTALAKWTTSPRR